MCIRDRSSWEHWVRPYERSERKTAVGASNTEEFGLYIKRADKLRQPGLTSVWWLAFNIVFSVLNCRLLTTLFVSLKSTLMNQPRAIADLASLFSDAKHVGSIRCELPQSTHEVAQKALNLNNDIRDV